MIFQKGSLWTSGDESEHKWCFALVSETLNICQEGLCIGESLNIFGWKAEFGFDMVLRIYDYDRWRLMIPKIGCHHRVFLCS